MTPRIGIPIPTSSDHAYNHLNWQAYADSVLACGADPVSFPLDLSRREALALSSTCRAICLPGSPADVSPARYGQEPEEETAPADPAREAVDMLLLEEAFGHGKPLLGICFGLQMLNVWRGGTLLQDLAPLPVNHSAGRSVSIAHTISVAPGSLLETLVGPLEGFEVDGLLRVPVNSSHHQAVGIAGKGLRVTARCAHDGVVEAVELEASNRERFLLGVQWHPERTLLSSSSKGIFLGLVEHAANWHCVAV